MKSLRGRLGIIKSDHCDEMLRQSEELWCTYQSTEHRGKSLTEHRQIFGESYRNCYTTLSVELSTTEPYQLPNRYHDFRGSHNLLG